MSSKYKISDQATPYFVTYTTVGWVNVFTRSAYRDIILDSLNYCSEAKGLAVHAWVLMTNHVHAIIGTRDKPIETIMRDHERHNVRGHSYRH